VDNALGGKSGGTGGPASVADASVSVDAPRLRRDTLTVTDNRTGRSHEFPIVDGTVRALDFRGLKDGDEDFGLMLYDPAFNIRAERPRAFSAVATAR